MLAAPFARCQGRPAWQLVMVINSGHRGLVTKVAQPGNVQGTAHGLAWLPHTMAAILDYHTTLDIASSCQHEF